MARVKRGKMATKRRRNVLRRAKGFRHGLKSKERAAKVALYHAGEHSFRDRRRKKGVMRALAQTRINAALRPVGFSYSKFAGNLKKRGLLLDRKILAELSTKHPAVFAAVVSFLRDEAH